MIRETIIAQRPDVVVTSPFFLRKRVEALSGIGIPVVQTELKHDPEARITASSSWGTSSVRRPRHRIRGGGA